MKNYKTIVVAVLSAVLGYIHINAETFVDIDGCTYSLDDNNTTAKLYNARDIVYNSTVDIPAAIVHEGVTYTVTSIGAKVFDNKTVHKIIIPSTVETFGAKAFYNASIDSLIIADGGGTIKVEKEDHYDRPTGFYTWTYSFGGYSNKYKYVYLGRKTNMYEQRSGSIYNDNDFNYIKSKADTLEIGPLVTQIDDLGVEIQTLNIPYLPIWTITILVFI